MISPSSSWSPIILVDVVRVSSTRPSCTESYQALLRNNSACHQSVFAPGKPQPNFVSHVTMEFGNCSSASATSIFSCCWYSSPPALIPRARYILGYPFFFRPSPLPPQSWHMPYAIYNTSDALNSYFISPFCVLLVTSHLLNFTLLSIRCYVLSSLLLLLCS